MNTIFTKTFEVQNKQKAIKLVNDDLANVEGNYDLLVCSAYKGDYVPVPNTVIGKLWEMGINVKQLSANPQINCKDFGAWISQDTGNDKFTRVCCVELLNFWRKENDPVDIILKKTFSTLKYVIEQASIVGVSVKKIILPILGAGSQGIELSYVIPPLISQVKEIFNLFDVDEITFFEINERRATLLGDYLYEALDAQNETDVFISYSSKQSKIAYEFADLLKQNNISYWMAPESIPPSRNYLDEIPNALTNTKMVLLILTPESESSVWVSKEVATAMGSNKEVIPCQLVAYDISKKFKFLLDGCQIFACYRQEDYSQKLIEIINSKKQS